MKILILGLFCAASSTPGDWSIRGTQEPVPIVNGEFDRDENGRLVGWNVGDRGDRVRTRPASNVANSEEAEWTDGVRFVFPADGDEIVLSQPLDGFDDGDAATLRVGLNMRCLDGGSARVECLLLDEEGRTVSRATMPEAASRWGRRFVDLQVPDRAGSSELRLSLRRVGSADGGAVEIDRLSVGRVVPDGPEFVSIFNGVDLDGWTGSIEGFGVEQNAIRTHPERAGGNLFTQRQFDDFILRFDFKLEPGSNNGIAIRAPLEGDPAYEGLEVQVLDSGDARYAGLAPWQVHGSVYGIAPALRGYLAPPGQWNSEEIRVEGRRVTVVLNGMRILDCDLDQVTRDGTLSGRVHPGLNRRAGHLGFCGHGDVVWFRDLRVRPISGTSAPASR